MPVTRLTVGGSSDDGTPFTLRSPSRGRSRENQADTDGELLQAPLHSQAGSHLCDVGGGSELHAAPCADAVEGAAIVTLAHGALAVESHQMCTLISSNAPDMASEKPPPPPPPPPPEEGAPAVATCGGGSRAPER